WSRLSRPEWEGVVEVVTTPGGPVMVEAAAGGTLPAPSITPTAKSNAPCIRLSSSERGGLGRTAGDPSAEHVELRRGPGSADGRHGRALGRGELADELRDEEARVRVTRHHPQLARGLRSRVGGWCTDQVRVRGAGAEAQASGRRGAVARGRGAGGRQDRLLNGGKRHGAALATRRFADKGQLLVRALARGLEANRQAALGDRQTRNRRTCLGCVSGHVLFHLFERR